MSIQERVNSMLGMFRKSSVKVPASNEKVDLETVQLTYVRWLSRHGKYNHETRECVEAFVNPEDANRFASALRDAFALIRHTSGTGVVVYQQDKDGK